MYETQLALINRLQNAVDSTGSSIFSTANVAAYSGEIGTNGVKTTLKLPAALVMFRSGVPAQSREGNKFDILIVTESQSFIKKTHLNNNLQKAGDVMWFLSQRPGWAYSGKDYLVQGKQKITSRLLLQNNRHTIITVSVSVAKLV